MVTPVLKTFLSLTGHQGEKMQLFELDCMTVSLFFVA